MADPSEPPAGEPIGYRSRADDRRAGGWPVLACLVGGLLGIAVPVAAGFFLGIWASDAGSVARWGVAAGWGAVAAAALFGVRCLRPADRRWFAASFMLTLGVFAAIEGLCFAVVLDRV